MTMADNVVDLNFLAQQNQRIISEVGVLRDENRVLTAICTRLESAQPAVQEQMRALQSLIGRLDERFRTLEADGGMSAAQVDAIANQLQPRLLDALSILISAKLFVAIDARFEQIQDQLSALNERLDNNHSNPQ
jgi:chromosome segregation ATPase